MTDDAARDITFADILMCYGLQPEVALGIAHEFGDEDVDCCLFSKPGLTAERIQWGTLVRLSDIDSLGP